MGIRDRFTRAGRIEREIRSALNDHVDNPTAAGAGGREATHRRLQMSLRQAQQANARRTH